MMDENKGYFIMKAYIGAGDEQSQQSAASTTTNSTTHTEVHLDLEPSILKDKKIKDEDLMSKESPGTVSPCYTIKSLWGIPK